MRVFPLLPPERRWPTVEFVSFASALKAAPAVGQPMGRAHAPALAERRQWWPMLACTLALTLVGAALMGPLWQRQPFVAAATVLLTAAASAAGVILWGEIDQRTTAVLLVLAGLFWSGGWVEEWGGGPLPLSAALSSPTATVLGAWAVLRYPDPQRVARIERLFLVTLATWEIGGQLALAVTDRREWSHYPPSTWWLTLHADRDLREAIAGVMHVGELALACAFVLLFWLHRVPRIRGLDRRLLAPIATVAPIAAVVSAAVPLAQLRGASGTVLSGFYAVETALLASVPCAFLITVIRQRLARTAVLDLVREVQRRPTPEAVQEALRTALQDPSLRVSYWVPDLDSYVDADGRPVEPVPEGAARLVLPVSNGAGQRLAIIDTDPGLRRHPQVLAAAASAGALALENAQLQAALRVQLLQVRASQLRTVEAGVAERRRLERDLHDGAQQRLLALRLILLAADDDTLLPSTRSFLRNVGQEITLALGELRELARGIHPAVLAQAGLGAAVEAAVERQDLDVEARLPRQRFPAATEATAYFIISEALDNAARHAQANRVLIRGHAEDGILTIEVEDDGRGGAQVLLGTGLGGLIDRVRALGGDMMLSSPPGGGTLVVAAIPCG